MIAAIITFQSRKILLRNINSCAVFWPLISLQNHASFGTIKTGHPGLYFIVSLGPETARSHHHSLFHFFYCKAVFGLSAHSLMLEYMLTELLMNTLTILELKSVN